MSAGPRVTVPAPARGGRVTFEEFLAWGDDTTHAEWVDGEILAMSPASVEHQDLVGFVAAIMRHYAEHHRLGKVLTAPFAMRLDASGSAREPDVLFVASANLGRMRPVYLEGPADLAVEFVSGSSRTRDCRDKRREYALVGVTEYWVVDPDRQAAEFLVLTARGEYEAAALSSQGRFESRVLPGLWLDVAWFWQQPLPSLVDVLRAWGLIS